MEQRLVKIDVPSIDEISGFAIIKLLKNGYTNTIKVIFRNTWYLDVTYNLSETLIFSKDEALDIVDLMYIWYYKVKMSTIHITYNNILSLSQSVFEDFNKLTNTVKGEEQNPLIHALG